MILHKATSLAIAITVAITGATIATPALAGMPHNMEMTCPVGGGEFTHTGTSSYSTFGSRPDGKPYGSWTFPIAIPECPDNGLIMYREFDDSEIPALTEVVLSDEYQALRPETDYYRAQWLDDRLSGSASSPPWLLLRAAWQVDHQPERKARYQREFAERAQAIAVDADDLDSLYLRFRVANAWRELSEFDRATAALESIPTSPLDVEVPDRSEADYMKVREAKSRRNLLESLDLLRALIGAGNTQSEPLTMIPLQIAVTRCAKMLEANKGDVDRFCSKAEHTDDIAEARADLRK